MQCNALPSHTGDTSGKAADQKSKILLILYEFEAKCKLGDPDVEKILDEAVTLSHIDAKTFETIAGRLYDYRTELTNQKILTSLKYIFIDY